MNQIITTTLRRHPLARRLRRVLHLHHAALVLVALVAASCAADPFDDRHPDDATDPDVLTFAVSPRPAFTEVPTTRADGLFEQEIAGQARNDRREGPTTRATQTDNATRWEQGDILWLDIHFYRDKPDRSKRDTIHIFSALKYDIDKWRYLTETEAEALNTGHIPNFSRLARYPRGWKDWVNPSMEINTFYAGSGKPDTDGTLTIFPTGEIPATPFIGGGTDGICSLDGKPVSLTFVYYCSRIRIPAGYKVKLENALYFSEIEFSSDGFSMESEPITDIPEQSKDTDVFVWWLANHSTVIATLTRDGVSWTFTLTPIAVVDNVNAINYGASYTLTPYTSGTQSPVADYDLTVATEAGLRAFAQAVNAGDRLPNGKPAAEARVLQTENIELTKEWVPIGNNDTRFRGAYNGNGHEIAGLTITTVPQFDALNNSYAGLFGYVDGAVLTGIRLREVGINITKGSGADDLYVGSIAGFIENSTLSLCSADGMVNMGGTQYVYAGGIAGGSDYSTISRCQADVEIKNALTHAYGDAFAGGIAGKNVGYSFILSCEIGDRAVTAEGNQRAYAGGITGQNKNSFIAFCRTGENVVTARNGRNVNYAGGLVGENFGNLYSCYSRATAKATGTGGKRAGAIVGFHAQNSVQHCYGAGATGQGTSNLDAVPDNIVYNTNPKDGDIHRLMTGFTNPVESIIVGGKTYYPFTTTYDPSATPAYGIIPQRAVWTKDAWKDGGSDPKFPEINMEYEGE